jgi:hypothetical protein
MTTPSVFNFELQGPLTFVDRKQLGQVMELVPFSGPINAFQDPSFLVPKINTDKMANEFVNSVSLIRREGREGSISGLSMLRN